jgi:hypothetical protein
MFQWLRLRHLTFAKTLQRLRNSSGPLSIGSTFGGPPAAANTPFQFDDEPLGGTRPLDNVQRRAPGMFVDHRGDLDRLAVHGRIELKVDRPHHIRGVGPDRRDRRHPHPPARRDHLHLQPLVAPHPMHLLLVDLTALVVTQRRPRTPEPMTRVFGDIAAQPGPHVSVRIGRGLGQGQASMGFLAADIDRQLDGFMQFVRQFQARRASSAAAQEFSEQSQRSPDGPAYCARVG